MDRQQLLNDPEEAMRLVLKGHQVGMWTALPAIVTKVDLTKLTVSAQPAIQQVIVNPDGLETPVNLPELIQVPLVFPQAGGFALTLPVQVGDEVLIVFASRCIDAWWQSGGVQQAMEARMHDLSDGFAIPGPFSQPNVLSGVSTTGAQLRNQDGTSYIEMAANGAINIVSPEGINLVGPVGLTGSLVASGQVTAGGIPLSSHKHSGVTTGTGTSGGPVP